MSNESISPLDIQVLGSGRDEWGRLYIQLAVNGDKLDPVSLESLSRDKESFFAALTDAGAKVLQSSTKTRILKLIEETPTEDHYRVVARVGLHDGCFVLPSRIIGEQSGTVEQALGQIDLPLRRKYRSQGKLRDWQGAILPLCEGNSRLMFSVCFSLASVVAAVAGTPQKSGGFQIFGPAESGKTTAALVAGSVWGCHQESERSVLGFCESWNATSANLEQTICGHTHVGLTLDETGLFDGDHGEVIMRLAEGVTKGRWNQPSARGFQGFVLSTSNLPTWDLVQSGKRIKEAVLSRMTDIPLPTDGYGLYETLRDYPDGAALSDALKTAATQHFGCAGPAFLTQLMSRLASKESRKSIVGYIQRRRDWYLAAVRKAATETRLRLLQRPADRFASVYAAGRLAKRFGILNWSNKALQQAILSCHLDALKGVQPFLDCASLAPVTPSDGLKRLQLYIEQNRSDFIDLDAHPLSAGKSFDKGIGYAATFGRKKWFYFEVTQFKQIVGGERTAHGLADLLASKALIVRSTRTITTQRPVYAEGKGNQKHTRVVAVRRRVLKEVA